MKKTLAIILALLMILSLCSLAACGEKEAEEKTPETQTEVENTEKEDEGITEEVLKASKNNEYIAEKMEAGWDLYIALSAQGDNYFINEQLFAPSIAYFEENGFSAQAFHAANAQITDQINQLETLVTANECCAIGVQTQDPAALQSVIEQAQEQGISIVIYGIDTEYDTIITKTDTYRAGYGAGVMAADWAAVKYPDAGEGEIKCCVLGSQQHVAQIALTEGLLDSVNECPAFSIAYYGDNQGSTLEDGFDGAEAAMLVDPDIRVFVVFQMSAGLGINNYLEASGADMTQFGIFATSEDDTTPGMLEAAENGKGAFRGTIVAGNSPSYSFMHTIVDALYGKVEIGTVIVDPMHALTTNEFTCDYVIE